jgi:hypothetical protein
MPLCFSYTQVKDGKLVFMGEEMAEKPFVCWTGKDYTYEDPTPTNLE